MKTWKKWLKRIASTVCAAAMCAAMLPATAFAEGPETTDNYEVTIQAVVRDSEGQWVSTNELPTKTFTGTTVAGSSGGGSESQWQWTPSENGYVLTATLSSHANAWGGLKYPTSLWEYDTDKLTFVGIGKNSYSTDVLYPEDVNDAYLFERNSYLLANSSGGGYYLTYIFEEKAPEPEPEPEPEYTITGFTKERVTGGEPNDAVFKLDGYTINYDDGTIDFTENESVTLLYKLTVTGNEGACYNIEDQGASLVGWTEPTKPGPIDGAFVGEIPANGTAYFYVAKTFTAADIQNGKLVNTATITGATPDDGLDAAIDPDGNNQYTVTAETDATGPETGDEKVSKPGLEKWIVTEDGNKIEMDDIAAGTTVNFQLNSNVPDDLGKYITVEADDPTIKTANSVDSVNSYELTFVDTLDRMFDDPTNFEVKIGDKVLTEDQYALDLTDTHNFMITLDLAELYHAGVITNDDIKNTTPITVTYAATLNKEATAGIYANKAQVVYTDGDSYEGSSMDTVWVRTYALDVFKYDQATNEGLEGAEFVLTLLDDDKNDVSSWMLTSGADGKIHVDGLDAGSYELRETKAPEGYVCSDEVLKFDISYEAAGSDYMIEIEFANVLIPHTGGTGTLMYTIGGIAIIALAGVLLIVYRKSRKKQER